MFRNLRRRWRRHRALKLLAPRLQQLRAELSAQFARPVTLEPSGARGRDSIFIARAGSEAIAVVRVANPYLKRKRVPDSMPYAVGDASARLAREWQCYEVGARLGITPRPLWRTADAIACEYVNGARLSARLDKQPHDFWALNSELSDVLGVLHAHGLAHMDASLANTIVGPDGLRLIDFEYHEAAHVTPAQARCYDHLRVVESGMKFVPDAIVSACDGWLDVVARHEPDNVLDASLAPLAPALPRVLSHTALCAKLSKYFPDLERLAGAKHERSTARHS